MTKTYYHATPYKNLESILEKGILKSPYDGVVYLATTPEHAARFVAIRLCREILVCEVQVEEDSVEEMFDHNAVFFQCAAYGYHDDIEPDAITAFLKYTS